MKKAKYVPAAIANYIPVLCACLFYRIGFYIWPVFIILQILIVILNHKIADSKSMLLILHANLLISTFAANWLSARLYYMNISSDAETLIAGMATISVGVLFIILLSAISLLIRYFTVKRNLS